MAKTNKPPVVTAKVVAARKKAGKKAADVAQSVKDRLRGKTRTPKTEKQYEVYNKKFYVNLKLGPIEEYDPTYLMVPKESYTDENMAKFILDLGK
jgi:hypothetical protein